MCAAVTGLCVIYGKNANPPPGYNIIRQDLNAGAQGEYIYLCYSTIPDLGPPITAIQVLSGDDGNFPIPPGYTKIDQDLNKGARGKFIYVCYACAGSGHPTIKGVGVVAGSTQHTYPEDNKWIRVNQDCNQGARGQYIYIMYRY